MSAKQLFHPAGFLIALALLLPFAPGCKTTIGTTRVAVVTVDAAMQAWASYAKAGLATPEQIEKVHRAYDRYYATVEAARKSVLAYKASGDTNELARAMNAIQAAEPEVLRLIFEFLPIEKSSQLKGLL